MEFNKQINLAVDCDEVLTYISPVWYYLLCQDYDYFSQYLKVDKDFSWKRDFGRVLARRNFDFIDEYGKNINKEDLPEEFYQRYFAPINNDNFYQQYCFPTKIAYALAELGTSNYVSSIHIISRSPEHNINSKIKFLRPIFEKCKKKVEYHILSLNDDKAVCINNIGNIDAVFDDELSHVSNIVENCTNPMDIYIPKLGYNNPTTELIAKASLNEKSIHYYNVMDSQTSTNDYLDMFTEYMII